MASLLDRVLHKHKATITFAPNFAFALTAKKVKESDLAQWDLSNLRVLGCGAEPIQPDTLRRFTEVLGKAKLNPRALRPCYGMAEATPNGVMTSKASKVLIHTVPARRRRAIL